MREQPRARTVPRSMRIRRDGLAQVNLASVPSQLSDTDGTRDASETPPRLIDETELERASAALALRANVAPSSPEGTAV